MISGNNKSERSAAEGKREMQFCVDGERGSNEIFLRKLPNRESSENYREQQQAGAEEARQQHRKVCRAEVTLKD